MRFAFAALLFFSCASFAAERPNFLLLFTDDHGYGDVSGYHPSDVRTPNIDRIGAEGMLFTAMRANCTVCSPSRAALLTGRYADRVGVPGVIRTRADDSWGYLAPGVPTLADELRKTGYHTAIIGKWHLGLESPNLPNERGFELFHGFLGDMMDSFTTHSRHGNNYMRRNGEVVYTLRIRGREFSPKVFRAGTYTLRVGEGAQRKEFKSVTSNSAKDASTLAVNL